MERALERRVSIASCWATARIAVLDSSENYEDSYAITQEFREWITCLGDHPEHLEDSVLKVPMFSKLEPSKLKLLAFTSQSLSFDEGEEIFHVGEPADSAYVIMAGDVDIISESESGEVVAATLHKNELFGELAVLTNSPRSASLRARNGLVAMRITDEMFLKLLAENPEVALDVMRQLSVKLTRTHTKYEVLRRELERLGHSPSV